MRSPLSLGGPLRCRRSNIAVSWMLAPNTTFTMSLSKPRLRILALLHSCSVRGSTRPGVDKLVLLLPYSLSVTLYVAHALLHRAKWWPRRLIVRIRVPHRTGAFLCSFQECDRQSSLLDKSRGKPEGLDYRCERSLPREPVERRVFILWACRRDGESATLPLQHSNLCVVYRPCAMFACCSLPSHAHSGPIPQPPSSTSVPCNRSTGSFQSIRLIHSTYGARASAPWSPCTLRSTSTHSVPIIWLFGVLFHTCGQHL